jgi:hypothetical protein
MILSDAISSSEVMTVVEMTTKGINLMDRPPELPTLVHSSTNPLLTCYFLAPGNCNLRIVESWVNTRNLSDEQ